MNTLTLPGSVPTLRTPGGITFTRLCGVELRKQVDTRAGLWLLIVIALVNTALIVLTLTTVPPSELTWANLTSTASLAQFVLLPLIGVMAATSEWSQRTGLTTFALEPRRTRVNLAKLVSAGLLGLLVMLLTVIVGAVLNVVGIVFRGGDGSWAMDWSMLAGAALALLLLVAQGVAFGLAFLSTPIAIVAYLALPIVWTTLTMFISGLAGPATWLDMNVTMLSLMMGEMSVLGWAQLTTSVAVWVGVPLAVGLWRTARRDVA
ncbi:ABC transporter permease [Cryobacterium frigoriphilum]|uniref:ABC transporter permease n=1 Tax=Cryobacterium frigoriphilum TaxID=1259150 RepID=A0A4V3IRZ3_9MICO|nr:ABC transporter permease [Cryobacterium frigoriphilum]TFD54053.1 ABC transporter permease [Cryobacterium frigoriphilum]